jgi:hypothetical protein
VTTRRNLAPPPRMPRTADARATATAPGAPWRRPRATSQLTQRDLRAALRFLEACDTEGGLEAFAASVTAALPALIPSEVTVFGSIDPRKGSMPWAVEHPRLSSPADLETFMRLTREIPLPLLSHYAATDDREARRISDFLSRRQFHRLPVYADFFRKFRVESELGVLMHSSPTAFDGITLNRERPDFDERERTLLTLLRPHLVQGYHTAQAFDRLRTPTSLSPSGPSRHRASRSSSCPRMAACAF